MKYEPTKQSIKQHEVPDWFNNAKLGIFIHWGIYSVPAFAITGIDLNESMKRGIEDHFKNNPYAEWYLNTLRIKGSPTGKYHEQNYGEDFKYDDFVPIFNEEIKKWNPNEMAELFKKAGARYVVLVTKHHDGFLMWSSRFPNPRKEGYQASRNIVGELTKAVREKGMKMGFYYSGALDWSFTQDPIKDGRSFVSNGPDEIEYTQYANNHWYELIDDYNPIILWNDIGYPPNTNVYEIFAYFYNKIHEGIINDRWKQFHKSDFKHPKVRHWDFLTPEYEMMPRITDFKWESTRGVGFSYGYNKMETEKDYLSTEKLIRMFVDIVSKNGNLLLNIGPKPDGTIPELQKKAILGLGKWLEVNGESIYGSRPWIRAEGKTISGIEVRFTQNDKNLYIHLLDKPIKKEITIKMLKIGEESELTLLGRDKKIYWKHVNEDLNIKLDEVLIDAPTYVFRVTPKPIE